MILPRATRAQEPPYDAVAKFYKVYSGDSATDPDLRISHVAIDRTHTTAEDKNSYLPLVALRKAVEMGLIGGLAPRFHGLPTNRSHRTTIEFDCVDLVDRVGELRPRVLVLQVGGPIGIDDGPWIAELANSLNLSTPSRSWHTARDGFAELASWVSLVTDSVGKIGQDIAMMAQNEIGEVVVEGGGKSSAMHHKSNPVAAEILVVLARYNAGLCGIVHQSLVHEQERSGAAWALEWMCFGRLGIDDYVSDSTLDRLEPLPSLEVVRGDERTPWLDLGETIPMHSVLSREFASHQKHTS